MKFIGRKLGLFRKKEDGSATIEFVILFPAFMSLFLMGFESGFYMVRNVMLERAVDISVRDIRLGNGRVPQFNTLRRNICENSVVLPDCLNSVQVQMEQVDIVPGGIDAMRGNIRCINRDSSEDVQNDTQYDVGQENTMMVLRVCMVQRPFFPTTGIGAGLNYDDDGKVVLVATSAFVNEPGTRAFSSSGSTGPGELDEPFGGAGEDVADAGGDGDATTSTN